MVVLGDFGCLFYLVDLWQSYGVAEMREKLIEILRQTRYEYRRYIGMKDMEKRMAKTEEEFLAIDDSILGEIPFCADYLLSNDVMVQKWISVKDRLPEKNGTYLTYTEKERIHLDCFCIYPNHGTQFWVRGNGKVTHWMPLPQPPKGE